MATTRDDDVLGGEPRIGGTRVGVRHVTARVIDRGRAPAYVADQLDVGRSEVYGALSCYYARVDEMREIEAAFEWVRESSLKPKGTVRWRPFGFSWTSTSDASSSERSASESNADYRNWSVGSIGRNIDWRSIS